MHYRYFLLVLSVSLCGCAATPMATEAHTRIVSSQAEAIQLRERCCADVASLTAIPLHSAQEIRITNSTAVTSIGDNPSPTTVFELPEVASNDAIQIFSFGAKKGGLLRLDRTTFIKPNVLFLDSSKDVIPPMHSPGVCWGSFDFSSAGVWSRVKIPSGARFVAIAPSITPPNQFIDTRGFAVAPGIQAIAEARKSYLSQVSFGYDGVYSISVVASSSPPLGRCTADAL